ncbi:hypothetical protein [Streptomyces sp. 1222.5]|uniref:hypothetical protein n=1 Tax=Streptomyces sp. 1222.5 TaxID=1881026 RepID=UPI003D7162AA
MTTRPIPPHGSYARANGSVGYRKPCYCPPCTEIKRRANKRWKVNAARGISTTIDAAAARAHLAKLRETRTWASISSASGLAESGLLLISNGQRTAINVRSHNRILAVQPLPKPDPSVPIDALGSRRRLQALAFVGHSVRTLAAECRVSRPTIRDLVHGTQTEVRRDAAERIEAAYERLAFRPPAANKHTSRTRNLAVANGWHGPLAWDDIDDPAEQPEQAAPYEPATKYERDPDKRAEIEHLYLLGESVPSIAKQLGNSEKYIGDQLGAILRQRARRASQQKTTKEGLEVAA